VRNGRSKVLMRTSMLQQRTVLIVATTLTAMLGLPAIALAQNAGTNSGGQGVGGLLVAIAAVIGALGTVYSAVKGSRGARIEVHVVDRAVEEGEASAIHEGERKEPPPDAAPPVIASDSREHQLSAGILVLLNFVVAYITALLVAIALGYFDYSFAGYSLSDVVRVAIFAPVLVAALRLRPTMAPPRPKEGEARRLSLGSARRPEG